MTDKQKLETLWNSLDVNSISVIKELFEKNTDAFLEVLIDKILDKEKFEIGLFEEGRQSGSILTYKESQKEIELRLKKNSAYDLILTVEDVESETFVFRSKLSNDEIKLIPENIQNLMYKVREIELPLIFFNTLAQLCILPFHISYKIFLEYGSHYHSKPLVFLWR